MKTFNEELYVATLYDDNSMDIRSCPDWRAIVSRTRDIMILDETSTETPKWTSFEDFLTEIMTDRPFDTYTSRIFETWVNLYYILQDLEFEPVVKLTDYMWTKTYELYSAVTEEERRAVIGGWHVFTDGKTRAAIWSSDASCVEIAPLLDLNIVYLSYEFMVIEL